MLSQIWSDPRYEELSERERRRLFGEYRDVLREAEREEQLVRGKRMVPSRLRACNIWPLGACQKSIHRLRTLGQEGAKAGHPS